RRTTIAPASPGRRVCPSWRAPSRPGWTPTGGRSERMRRVMALVVAGALVWAGWTYVVAPRRAVAPSPPVDSSGAGYRAVRLFFAAPSGDRLVSESRELPESATLHERVAALVGELDRGPAGPGVAALPPGTSLLHVYLDDKGLMTIDLSRAFQQGFRGGAQAEYLALSSLVRT